MQEEAMSEFIEVTSEIFTLKRIRNDGRIENILFSHAYEPWNSDAALGRKRVLECIEECLNYLK